MWALHILKCILQLNSSILYAQ